MKVETQSDLIQAVWTNCNRISCLGNTELYFISHNNGEAIPSFYTRFLTKNFSDTFGYNSFFAEVNRIKNRKRFMQMLNESGGFTLSDILLGSLTKRQNMEIAPVMEYVYE